MKKIVTLHLLVLLLALTLVPGSEAATTWYVDINSPSSSSGASWATAYNNLHSALSSAQSGDTIKVADGVYKPPEGSRESSFSLKSGVAIYGGFAGYGAPNPDERNPALYKSILSGDIGVTGDNTDNVYHVVYADSVDNTTKLSGFTITGGNASVGKYPDDPGKYRNQGAGIFLKNSSPEIWDCTISNNIVLYGSGGIGMIDSSPWIVNCIFSSNNGAWGGGGLGTDPTSTNYPSLFNCLFTGNTAAYGGAIYIQGGSISLTNCTVSENSSTGVGGSGGGLRLINTVATIVNSILWGNIAGNGAQVAMTGGCTLNINYSDLQGGTGAIYNEGSSIIATGGMLDTDPMFVGGGNYHLQNGSPCIDAGTSAGPALAITWDIEWVGRPQGAGYDIGAYEYVPPPTSSTTTVPPTTTTVPPTTTTVPPTTTTVPPTTTTVPPTTTTVPPTTTTVPPATTTTTPPAEVTVDFMGSPTSGKAPLTVQFTNFSTGTITDYKWLFGSGETSTEKNPVYRYTSPGTYSVTLIAYLPDNTSRKATKDGYINVQGCPLVSSLDNTVQIEILRMARNTVLKNLSGILLTSIYYRNLAEVDAILDRNPDLRATLKHLVAENIGVAQQYVIKGTATMHISALGEAIDFLKAVREEGSLQLQTDIDMVLAGIERGYLMYDMGIVVE